MIREIFRSIKAKKTLWDLLNTPNANQLLIVVPRQNDLGVEGQQYHFEISPEGGQELVEYFESPQSFLNFPASARIIFDVLDQSGKLLDSVPFKRNQRKNTE